MGKKDRRSEIRETVFLILFRLDFYDPESIRDQIYDFFEGEDCYTEAEKQMIAEKVLTITSKVPEIDEELDKVSVGWKVRRMTKVDLTALRLACYELKYDDSIPAAASINEAVELAKAYGTENSGSFVNGILAKIVKDEQ